MLIRAICHDVGVVNKESLFYQGYSIFLLDPETPLPTGAPLMNKLCRNHDDMKATTWQNTPFPRRPPGWVILHSDH